MPLSHKTQNIDVYNKSIQNHFAFLKSTVNYQELIVRAIPLPGENEFLVPCCETHREDDKLISLLADWRRENYFAYPTRFEVTIEGTRKWFHAQVLDNPERILFLIVDSHGYPIGHLGWTDTLNSNASMEVDNVVRGNKTARSGIMTDAMKALIDWAEECFSPSRMHLKVLGDNPHAIAFYENLGFVKSGEIPLRKIEQDDRVDYRECEKSDLAEPDLVFVCMDYTQPEEINPDSKILTAGPSITSREISYVHDAARHGWNANWSDYIKSFEREFAEYLGVKHAVTTSSCTGALHMAMLSLGIGPGDEVIVPDLTWVATAQAVNYTGAIPVFADIQKDSWCIDPDSFAGLITPKTKAVIPVHLYGHPAQMDRIMQIAKDNGLFVVEDAAPAIGAQCKGRKTGTYGDFAAFSFQGAKLLVTGEGGMLVTNDDALFEKIKVLWDQGRKPNTFWIETVGWKYKMSNIQAALGLAQLQRVDEQIEAKRKIFALYEQMLGSVEGISLNKEAGWAKSIYWMTSILLHDNAGLSREQMIAELQKRNISTRPAFPAISQYLFWPRKQSSQPVAMEIGERGINLPSGVRLKTGQIKYICESIISILKQARR